MASRPDIRDLATSVREAFADADRETLLEVLAFVVKEYVVDGPPPMMLHQVEQLADLRALSFAQLMAALQTRLEHPELTLFTVDGEQVSVRVGGAMHPLSGGRTPLAATPAPRVEPPPASELPRPAAGIRVVESQLPPRAAPATAPRPTGGMSLRGRPSDGEVGTPPAAPSAAPAPEPAKPSAPASAPGDDASARFSLLELD